MPGIDISDSMFDFGDLSTWNIPVWIFFGICFVTLILFICLIGFIVRDIRKTPSDKASNVRMLSWVLVPIAVGAVGLWSIGLADDRASATSQEDALISALEESYGVDIQSEVNGSYRQPVSFVHEGKEYEGVIEADFALNQAILLVSDDDGQEKEFTK